MTEINKGYIKYIVFSLISFGASVYLFNVLKRKLKLHEFYHSGLTDKFGIFILIVINAIFIIGSFKKYSFYVIAFWGIMTVALLIVLHTLVFGFDLTMSIFSVLSFAVASTLQLALSIGKSIRLWKSKKA